jgi:hypothetical protein
MNYRIDCQTSQAQLEFRGVVKKLVFGFPLLALELIATHCDLSGFAACSGLSFAGMAGQNGSDS